jgi:integrase
VRRPRGGKSSGAARTREPVKEKRTRLWRAMYVDLDGQVRQAGRFRAKGAAREHSQDVVDKLNRGGGDPALTPSLIDFLDEWARRFPRHPRTEETNRERLERYILPYLPKGGHEQLGEVRRRTLLAVQDQLLRAGLSKTTIDGAFASLSALFRDAIELEYLEANPAHRLRVRPNDPRLSPALEPVARRAVPPQEIHAFMKHVRPDYRAVCWTPVLTSARPAELFAMRRRDIDRERQMIFVAETLTRYGKQMEGLKQTHHISDRGRRGRWLLFPEVLYEMLDERPRHLSGLLYPSPRGRRWSVRNFYRDVWDPARKKSGVSFKLARHRGVAGGGVVGAHRARDRGVETPPAGSERHGTRIGCRAMPKPAVHKNVAKKWLLFELPLWKARKPGLSRRRSRFESRRSRSGAAKRRLPASSLSPSDDVGARSELKGGTLARVSFGAAGRNARRT